ncbi:hypothetical protein ACEPAH_8006 [Sanghuangporus vaninii]
MLTRGKSRASKRITRSKGFLKSEVSDDRGEAARSARGVAKNVHHAASDERLQTEIGDPGQTTQGTLGDAEADQAVVKGSDSAPQHKAAGQASVLLEKLSVASVTSVDVAVSMPIPLVATLPRRRVLQRPQRSRPIIDSSGSSYNNYIFLNLETNDAFQPPAKTRILEIVICVANKNFEPLDAGFSFPVH